MRISFTGFAGDCLISGRLDLAVQRLTDHLNRHASLILEDVVLEGLDGGRVSAETFTIERSQLCAALGSGPRGARTLRIPTDERRIQAQIGPYAVLGRYHGRVGDANLRSFSEREPMVPLTDATIAYMINGILEVRDAPVLIVNRTLAAWYREPDEEPSPVRVDRGEEAARRAKRTRSRRGADAARQSAEPPTLRRG